MEEIIVAEDAGFATENAASVPLIFSTNADFLSLLQ